MSKFIRRAVKKEGTAMIVALQLTALTIITLISFFGGPKQPASKAPTGTEASAPAQAQAQTDQAQTQTD